MAAVCLVAMTALFLDWSGLAATHWGWLARYQVVPALLSLNVAAIVVLVLLTLFLGRVYCSTLCPLGVLQDLVLRVRIWLSGKRKRRIGVYRHRKGSNALRYVVFVAFALAVIAGLVGIMATSLGALIEPYSMYGRISSGVFAPVTDAAENALAAYDAAHDGYTFWTVTRAIAPAVSAVGGISLVVLIVVAVLTGRGYCNNFCPVGTLLGFVSKHSLMRITIDTDKCNGCQSCARHCKGGCIDAKNHEIDYSRCVACMDCIDSCSQHAIGLRWAVGKPAAYSCIGKAETETKPKQKAASQTKAGNETAPHPTDEGRRNFMAIVGIATGALATKAADKVTDGGLTALKERKTVERAERIVPPGAISVANLNAKCVGCQLCVQNCPSGIIKTSTDLETFMQPYVEYKDGFCLPECTRCSDICPTGAIVPLNEGAKASTKVGTAVVNTEICLAASEGVDCGNCERYCPAGAVELVKVSEAEDDKHAIPVVNAELCIGCGACENHCPVGTVATMTADIPAIHVEGLPRQRTI